MEINMNIFKFELKRIWKSSVIWTVFLILFLIVLMSAVYPVFTDSRYDVEQVLKGFPPEFASAFGMYLDDIFSYGGFYSFCFLYVAIMGSVMAASLGIELFSREKRAKCTDFIMTKPVSRSKLFLLKLLVPLSVLVIMNILYTASLFFLCGTDGNPVSNVILAGSALFFTQLVILSIGTFIAVFLKKIRSVSGGAMAIAMGAFVLTALNNVLEDEALRYISVYKYFDVYLAFKEGSFEAPFVITAALITVILFIAAYLKYCRSDIHSV